MFVCVCVLGCVCGNSIFDSSLSEEQKGIYFSDPTEFPTGEREKKEANVNDDVIGDFDDCVSHSILIFFLFRNTLH